MKEQLPRLLDCPFCGPNEPLKPDIFTVGRLVHHYKILCGNLKCNATRDVMHKSIQEAADHWNNRG
jgi:transcription elongation factor Elf1